MGVVERCMAKRNHITRVTCMTEMTSVHEKIKPQAAGFAAPFLKAIHDFVFSHVHGGQLIYNTSWEDPRIDRQLLKLDHNSKVVMITSAGCNVLDYLLDGPAQIDSVDVNFRQNALLELKLAMIRRGNFSDFFAFFGIGSHCHYRDVYRSIRQDLPMFARAYWDSRMHFFDPRGLKKSFYYRGTSGAAAWMMCSVLFKTKPHLKTLAMQLLNATSLEQQREVFARLEPKIWNALSSWLVRQRLVMTLLGVPRPQVKLIEDGYPGGLGGFIKDKLRHVMCELPTAENYFWRVYLTGSYTDSCCPNYLLPQHFSTLNCYASRVRTHSCTISEFLKTRPGEYTHYILLDHQDWLAWHDPAALREEWEHIFANSRPGTKILMRSAGLNLDFVPADIRVRLRFFPEMTEPLHQLDRVGTYGNLSFAEVL